MPAPVVDVKRISLEDFAFNPTLTLRFAASHVSANFKLVRFHYLASNTRTFDPEHNRD